MTSDLPLKRSQGVKKEIILILRRNLTTTISPPYRWETKTYSFQKTQRTQVRKKQRILCLKMNLYFLILDYMNFVISDIEHITVNSNFN